MSNFAHCKTLPDSYPIQRRQFFIKNLQFLSSICLINTVYYHEIKQEIADLS